MKELSNTAQPTIDASSTLFFFYWVNHILATPSFGKKLAPPSLHQQHTIRQKFLEVLRQCSLDPL